MVELTSSQLQQLRRDGFVATDVVFDAELLQRLRGEFERVWRDAIDRCPQSDERAARFVRTRPFLADLHRASDECARFLKHPQLLAFCRQLIGPRVECMYNQAVIKPPSEQRDNAFAWHQDAYYGIHGSHSHLLDHAAFMDLTRSFVCWVAVSRATIANGALWVVPGSHARGLLPHTLNDTTGEWICQFDSSNAIPVELEAGRMLIFSTLLAHRSGPNVSDETRMAYQFTYTVPGVRRVADSVFVAA